MQKIKPKFYLCLLVLFSFFPTTVFGETEYEPAHSLFWKVESTAAAAYILGSIHMLDTGDFYPFPDYIEDAFVESGSLVVEINVLDTRMEEVMSLVGTHASLEDGETLSSVLPDSVYASLKEQLGALNLSVMFFERQKPAFVAVILAALQYVKYDLRPEHGVDFYFTVRAQAEGKEIIELETPQEQLALFCSLDMDTQVLMLEDTLHELTRGEKIIAELIEAYKQLDGAGIKNILFEAKRGKPEFEKLYEIILDNRNVKMTDKIQTLLHTGESYFVVIGAGHLFGEKGVVNLLRQKGFDLTSF